jgi:hypothetical protein
MKPVRVPALALLVIVSLVSAGSDARLAAQQPAAQSGGISAEALAQIGALVAE